MGTNEHTLTKSDVPIWPSESGPFVVLVDASSSFEAELINAWIADPTNDVHEPIDVFRYPPSRPTRPILTA